jgi:hypothetical protein
MSEWVSLGISLHRDCNAMGDAAKISPHIPSTSTQNAILLLPIGHICRIGNIYVAINNQSIVPSVSGQLLVAISGNPWVELTTFPRLKTCKATAVGAFLTCTKFETGSKFPEFSGVRVSARANQYSAKAPSSYRSLILNSCCSYHRRHPFSAP